MAEQVTILNTTRLSTDKSCHHLDLFLLLSLNSSVKDAQNTMGNSVQDIGKGFVKFI